MTTRQEQVLMHLYRFKECENTYEMPFGTTQDGIAESVGISRGHASLTLKNLMGKGLIRCEMKHPSLNGGRQSRSRRCYTLNHDGRLAAKDVFAKCNIEVE